MTVARKPVKADAPSAPEGYALVLNPMSGAVTTVPITILDALIASGFVQQ